MEISVKFILMLEYNDNATWVEKQAFSLFHDLFKDYNSEIDISNFVKEHYSAEKSFSENDLSTENLMAFEDSEHTAYLQFISSYRNQTQGLDGNKPIFIDKLIYKNTDDALVALLDRAEQIARQRKYDVLWLKTFKQESQLIEVLNNKGYFEFDKRETSVGNLDIEQIFFQKKLLS